MRILITGGAGFIGSRISNRYFELGHDVAVLDNFSTGDREKLTWYARVFHGDICDEGFVQRVINDFNPEVVSHHAAHISVIESAENPAGNADVNITGALNVLQNAMRAGVVKFIFASSAAVYGDPQFLPITEVHPLKPTSEYGQSKSTVESYLDMWQARKRLWPVVLRYSNVYEMGREGQGVYARFYRAMQDGEQCVIRGDGSATRDYVHVNDVVAANVAALEYSGAGDTFNISTQTETATLQVFEQVKHWLGKPDAQPVFAATGEGEVERSVLSNARAREVLGWQGAPFSLNEDNA